VKNFTPRTLMALRVRETRSRTSLLLSHGSIYGKSEEVIPLGRMRKIGSGIKVLFQIVLQLKAMHCLSAGPMQYRFSHSSIEFIYQIDITVYVLGLAARRSCTRPRRS
jgi:hypothetical protein